MPEKMDDDHLKALVDQEVQSSLGYVGKLSNQRYQALMYYNGEAKGDLTPPEIDGRSAAVSTDLSETVEWIMPQLMRIFTQADDVVSCEPQKPGDEQKADQATAWCNYVLNRQNPGFQILHTWFKDALLSKNGIVKAYWNDKQDVTKEQYRGLRQEELAFITQDEGVEIVDQKAYPDPSHPAASLGLSTPPSGGLPSQAAPAPSMPPGDPQGPAMAQAGGMPAPMLYDVTLARTKDASCICIENVPPEEFLISRAAKSLDDAPFVGQRVRKTLSDLRAMGYKQSVIDQIGSDDNWADYNQEKIERAIYDDETGSDPASSTAESQKEFWLTECYYRVDYDGDGIAELRHILKAGATILENEEADDHPYESVTPIPMPHRFFGRSLYDIIGPIMRVRTTLLRGFIDGLTLANNPRYVALEGKVNLDDLLLSRPGGVVRVKDMGAVGPLQTMPTQDVAIAGLQFCDDWRENVTGVTKYNQGTDSNSLNKTASGMAQIMEASNQRIEMIARVFAEGMVGLFRKVLRLSAEYTQRATIMRLQGSWVPVDPREWKTQFDLTINVGLGAGNKTVQAGQLQQILMAQAQMIPLGIVQPIHVYNAFSKWVQAQGFKNADEFVGRPQPGQGPQTPPDPNAALAQAEIQKTQIKTQSDEKIAFAKMAQESQDRRYEALLNTGTNLITAGAQNQIDAQKTAIQHQDTVLSHLHSIASTAIDAHQNAQSMALDAHHKAQALTAQANKPAPNGPNARA